MLKTPVLSVAMLWALLSGIAFTVGQAMAKLLTQRLPPAEIAFFRAAAGFLTVLAAWHFLRELRRARAPVWLAARCILGVVTIYAFLDAISRIPLALAVLILFSRILLTPVLAHVFLGERPKPGVWAAIVAGLAGVALSLAPSLALEGNLGVLSAVVAAVASAGSQLAVRRLVQVNSPGLVVAVNALVAAAVLAMPATAVWVEPPVADFPALAAMGILALLAQYTTARAFALAPAAHVSALDVLGVPMAAVAGFLMFGEVPGWAVVVGSIPTLASAAYIMRLEGRE